MNKFFDFTGSEKSIVALGPLVLPLGTLVAAIMAYFGLGEMPDPVQIKDAIVFFLMTVVFARMVWQVPNSDVVKADTVEVKVPSDGPDVTVTGSQMKDTKTRGPVKKLTAKVSKPTRKPIEIEVPFEPVKRSTIEENPV
jgi:hypothetical protein